MRRKATSDLSYMSVLAPDLDNQELAVSGPVGEQARRKAAQAIQAAKDGEFHSLGLVQIGFPLWSSSHNQIRSENTLHLSHFSGIVESDGFPRREGKIVTGRRSNGFPPAFSLRS